MRSEAAEIREAFIDALRACLDKDPLYSNRRRTEAERFYTEPQHEPGVDGSYYGGVGINGMKYTRGSR